MSRPDLSNRFVFDDPRYEQLAIEGEAKYKLGTPFNHMAFDNFLPEDIAEAVFFFASDMSAKSTGNMINVDAGNAQAFTR